MQLEPYLLRDFSGGQVTEVADALLPANAMRLIENMDADVVGALRVRRGTTAIGDQLEDGKNILGVYQFRDSGSGTNHRQIAVVNNAGDTVSALEYNNSGTWTAIAGGASQSASAKHRFATFLDRVFVVNSSFNSPLSWDGNASSSLGATQLSSAPSGQFIAVYKSRLYIASTSANPDRVFFSSIVSIAGNITWATSTDYLDVNPSDGQNITGLENNGTLLLIFKDHGMYRWNGAATDPELVIDVGCSSQESIATRNGMTFFFNPFGIYATTGGQPKRLSAPIQRWIDAISGSYYQHVAGVCDEDSYYCSIGDITVDNEMFNNVVLVYRISARTWSVRTYPEQIRVFANFIDTDSTEGIMLGNDDGDVLDFNSGSTDTSTGINYRVKTKRVDFVGSWLHQKGFTDITAFGDGLAGARTNVLTNSESRPKNLRELLTSLWQRMKGYKFRGRWFEFELSGTSVDGRGLFHGWEIADPYVDELVP